MQTKRLGGTLVWHFLLIFGVLTHFSFAETLITPLRQFGHPAGPAAFSPDGSKLMLGGVKARLLDANTGATIHYFGEIIDKVRSVAYSPDGTKIATGGAHSEYPPGTMGTLQIWNPVTGTLIHSKNIPGSFMDFLGFSQDGSKILIVLSASQYEPLLVLDATTLQQIRVISDTTSGNGQTCRAVSSDGNRFAVGNQNGSVRIWNVNTGLLENTILTGSNPLWQIALSHDGQTLLTMAAAAEPLKLWNTATGGFIRPIGGSSGNAYSFFSPDSSKIMNALFGLGPPSIQVFDAITGNLIRSFDGWFGIFHPNSDKVLLNFKLYDIASGNLLRIYNDPSLSFIHSVDLSPDGNFLLTASDDTIARLWNFQTASLIRTYSGHTGWLSDADISPDGTRIVTASADKTAKIWNLATGALLHTFTTHTAGLNSAAYSPDGSKILTSSYRMLNLWNASNNSLIRSITSSTLTIRSAVFTPDSASILIGDDRNALYLWSIQTGSVMRKFHGNTSFTMQVAVSPDQKYVASAGWDGSARVWDFNTGVLLRTFTESTAVVKCVAFSPNGKHLVSGSSDNVVRWYDIASGNLLRSIKGHVDSVNSLSFTTDGRLLTASSDHTAMLWSPLQNSACDWLLYN